MNHSIATRLCQIAKPWLATFWLLLPTTTKAQLSVFEVEPNNTPADAQHIDGSVRLYGSMVGDDQDGFLWTVSDNDARKRWNFELNGIPGALTVVEVVRIEATEDGTEVAGVEGTEVAGVERIMKMGTRDGVTPSIHRGQLFEPGEYLIGVASAGGPSKAGGGYRPPTASVTFGESGVPGQPDEHGPAGDVAANPSPESKSESEGAWQFIISEGKALNVQPNPGARTSRDKAQRISPRGDFATFESEKNTWYSFTFDEQMATQRWDIEVRVPLGRNLRVRLVDSENQELLQASADDHGRVIFSDLAPEPGTWYLELITSEPGFIHEVAISAAGQRIAGEEAEPNNQTFQANRVNFDQPVTGRIDRSDAADFFRFVLDETSADQVLAFHVESTPPARMQICIYDADWTSLQCRDGTTPLELPDLVLPPGDWGVSLGRADETNYTLSMQSQGAIKPGMEAEPNDTIKSANRVPDNLRTKGRFTGQDADFYQFQITEEPQLWRFQLVGDNIHSVTYFNGAGEQRMNVRTEGGQRRVRLDNVFLLPGTHTLMVTSKRADEGGDYTLMARPLGPPDPNSELEPNDEANKQRLAFGQTRTGLITDKADIDNYRFFLANEDHIRVTLQPPADGHLWLDLSWYSEGIGNGRPAKPGEPLTIEGVFPPGDYQMAVKAVQPSDAEYQLSLERLPRFSCSADCEPNGMGDVYLAAPLPPDLVLEGKTWDWGDWDYYQLPAFDSPVELQLQTSEPVGGLSIGPYFGKRKNLTFDPALPGYHTTVPAGPASRIMMNTHGKQYRLQLVFPNGELQAVTTELPVELTLQLSANRVSAFQWVGQQISGEIALVNAGTSELLTTLEAVTSDHRWHITLEQSELALAAGARTTVPVTIHAPTDAWQDQPVRISVRASDANGRQVESWQEIAVDWDAPIVHAEHYWPIPEKIRGSFNAAWEPFGAEWSGDISNIIRPELLRDGLVLGWNSAGIRGSESCWENGTQPQITLDLPGDEPLPVAGMAINFFGTDITTRFIRRATLLLSLDGQKFEEAKSFDVQPLMTDQSFAIGRTVDAKFARLRVDATWQEASRCYGAQLSEWKVLLEPGFDLSAGKGFDIARPDLGGHVVWENPGSPGPDDILLGNGNAGYINSYGESSKEFVIGFNRNRAAQVVRVEWLNVDGQPEADHQFERLTVSASLSSPIGPWLSLGEMDLGPGREGAVLDLPQPRWARFIRLSADFKEGAESGKQPDVIRIWEKPTSDDYRSVLTEWGDTNFWAFYEWQAGIADEPAGLTSNHTSRERAAKLNPGEPVKGQVSLNLTLEHWYRFQAPSDHNTLTFTLDGSPTVRSVLEMEDEHGDLIPLRRIDAGQNPEQHRFEALVPAGSETWLHVYEPPRNVIFSWDTSPSVAGYIPRIRNALVAFSSQVVPGREAVNLMPFPQSPLLREWLSEPYMLQTILNDFDSRPGSSEALTTLKKASIELAPRPGTKAILVITDGETLPDAGAWKEMRKTRPRIFAVQVAGCCRWNLDKMRDWASIDAGDFRQLRYEGEMEVAFDRATAMMRRPADYTLMAESEFRETPGPGLLTVVREQGIAAGDSTLGGAAIELILDASGSMLQRVDGKRRITMAREVLNTVVREHIPAGTPVALRVFGHKEADSCRTDLEISLGPLDPAKASVVIDGIQARNLARTPIAASLAAVPADLRGRKSGTIVLVTDGEETCDGDPAAVINSLRAKGFDVNLNIVGFAIDNPELAAQFESWAELGGGQYYAADNQDGLNAALASALMLPFKVYNVAGAVVATGQVDGEPVELEAGYYKVVVATNPPLNFEKVEVLGENDVRLEIK